MGSRNVNILEQSTRECSTETATNVDPTEESPPDGNNISSTRLLTSSHPQYSAIGVPVPANGQSIEPEVREEPRVHESSTNAFGTFINWYRNTAINFRNSYFIYIIHLLFAYIPISAIIMGLLFNHECPRTWFLPIFVTIVGAVGVLFMGVGITASCYQHHGTPCSNLQKFALVVLFMLFSIGLVIEICVVCRLSPSFDQSAEDYCNKTFYYCLIGKEIMSGAAILIAALLYLPGSGLLACCRNCPVPSPAGAFFRIV